MITFISANKINFYLKNKQYYEKLTKNIFLCTSIARVDFKVSQLLVNKNSKRHKKGLKTFKEDYSNLKFGKLWQEKGKIKILTWIFLTPFFLLTLGISNSGNNC